MGCRDEFPWGKSSEVNRCRTAGWGGGGFVLTWRGRKVGVCCNQLDIFEAGSVFIGKFLQCKVFGSLVYIFLCPDFLVSY